MLYYVSSSDTVLDNYSDTVEPPLFQIFLPFCFLYFLARLSTTFKKQLIFIFINKRVCCPSTKTFFFISSEESNIVTLSWHNSGSAEAAPSLRWVHMQSCRKSCTLTQNVSAKMVLYSYRRYISFRGLTANLRYNGNICFAFMKIA